MKWRNSSKTWICHYKSKTRNFILHIYKYAPINQKLKAKYLTCMFHVRGRCVDMVVVTVAPEAVAVVVTDCWCCCCDLDAETAAAALACFVCCIIWLMRSSCCRVSPSFPAPAGDDGDPGLEPSLLYWMQVAPCGELASPVVGWKM